MEERLEKAHVTMVPNAGDLQPADSRGAAIGMNQKRLSQLQVGRERGPEYFQMDHIVVPTQDPAPAVLTVLPASCLSLFLFPASISPLGYLHTLSCHALSHASGFLSSDSAATPHPPTLAPSLVLLTQDHSLPRPGLHPSPIPTLLTPTLSFIHQVMPVSGPEYLTLSFVPVTTAPSQSLLLGL